MLESEVDKTPDSKGYIFDGFPRTTPQADALSTFLDSKGTDIRVMLQLDVPEDELVNRLLARGKDSGRADDADERAIPSEHLRRPWKMSKSWLHADDCARCARES